MDAQADFATQIKRIDRISAVFSMRECARVCLCVCTCKLDYTVLFRRQQTIANGKHRLIECPHGEQRKIGIII